jgi:hypothetical protein
MLIHIAARFATGEGVANSFGVNSNHVSGFQSPADSRDHRWGEDDFGIPLTTIGSFKTSDSPEEEESDMWDLD